jgi:hypothetical protein
VLRSAREFGVGIGHLNVGCFLCHG